MTKAYLNALYEEGSRKDLFDWVCKLDVENDQLRDDKRALQDECVLLRREAALYRQKLAKVLATYRPEEEIGVTF